MELSVETVTENRELSEYEIERNKPMPSKNHSIVQKNLLVSIDFRNRKNYTVMSEIDIIMPEKPDTVPDVAIYPKLKIDFFDDQIGMTEMPLTAIEIISPSQSDTELIKKINRYFKAGVKSCWLVNPAFQAIYVYSEIGKYQFFNSGMTLLDPATGIELPLSEIFAE
jgi:Uma2 family endonuclease